MPHLENNAGLARSPAVPGPERSAGQKPGTASGSPGLGVPVTIWPHALVPGSGPGPEYASCTGCARGPDAAQIITAFSRPGELVVIPDTRDGRLAATAAAAGRHVLCLAPGPCSRERVLACLALVDPPLRQLAEVRSGGPALLLQAGSPEAGQAALAITGGGEPAPGEPAARPGVLYAACQRVLRPGGVLAVITASTTGPGGLRDDPGEVISRARAAGLVYAQHIVALHVPVTGSQITPAPGDDAGLGAVAGLAAVHTQIHSDFLVFTQPGKPVGSAELKDSQPEPPGGFLRSPAADPWVHGEDEGPVS
jgi:hypothetical protein